MWFVFTGTGKTMLAKAVANNTKANFISVVGSEFVQKYLGEGPRMVRDVFRLAKENSPCIIFVDEVDAIATKRFDAQTGADREVQRILLEFLNQMDGFDQTTNVKVIMATNRADTLDPALLRPGRLDRKIEFPHPDRRTKRLIFQVFLYFLFFKFFFYVICVHFVGFYCPPPPPFYVLCKDYAFVGVMFGVCILVFSFLRCFYRFIGIQNMVFAMQKKNIQKKT